MQTRIRNRNYTSVETERKVKWWCYMALDGCPGFFAPHNAGVDPGFDAAPDSILRDDLHALLDGSATGQLTNHDTTRHSIAGGVTTPMLDPSDPGLGTPNRIGRPRKRKVTRKRSKRLPFVRLPRPSPWPSGPIANLYATPLVMPD